jgi:hypothetical protein
MALALVESYYAVLLAKRVFCCKQLTFDILVLAVRYVNIYY